MLGGSTSSPGSGDGERGGPLDGLTAPPKDGPLPKARIAFIDIGRGVAALLVFYSHIAEQWVAKQEAGPTPVVDFVDSLTSDPMHMGLQGIGQIAVPFFFLVSGFVVTPIALRQGQRRFGLNRLVRVYVPMVFAVLLTAVVVSLGAQPLAGAGEPKVTWLTVLTNSLVINYLIVPQVVLVGVAWTLVVEIIFYALLVLVLPVLQRWTWLALAGQLTFVFVVMMSARQFGDSWALFAVNVSYLPIPLIGQIIWATTSKRVPLWLGWVLGCAAWALYVLAEHLELGRLDTSYNLALAVAVLFFLLGMFAEPRLKERRLWTALSERSYSIYLLHGVVAFAVLDLLRPTVPLLLAVPLAVAATFGVVELSYRYVEQPSHALARRLSRKPKPKPKPKPEPEPEPEPDEFEDEFEDEEFEPEEEQEDEVETDVLPPVRASAPRVPPVPRRPPLARRVPTPQAPDRQVSIRRVLDRQVLDQQSSRRPPPERAVPRPAPHRQAPDQRVPERRPPEPRRSEPRPNDEVAPRPGGERRPEPRPNGRLAPDQAPERPPGRPAPRPAEPPTELVQPVAEPVAEPERPRPRRRRLREDDDASAVTVASLLANHAKENGRS